MANAACGMAVNDECKLKFLDLNFLESEILSEQVEIFYFIVFGFFCIESLMSIWVLQQVYMYSRGSGKAAELKREAARDALRATL